MRGGFIRGWLCLTNHADRFRGYQSSMAAAGLKIRERWVIDGLTLWHDEGGADGTHGLLSAPQVPTAVNLCIDFLVNGVYGRSKKWATTSRVISFNNFRMAAERLMNLISEPDERNIRE